MIIENIGADVTLVLHHPHFFDSSYWADWSAKTGCNIIAFDAPHHGSNGKHQSFKDFAAESVATARTHFQGPLIAAGVSQGGVIAQESAGQPGIAGVVGISTTREPASSDEVESMHQLLELWGEGYPTEDIASSIARGSTNGEDPAFSITAQAVSCFSASRLRHSVPLLLERGQVSGITVPTLYVHGTADQTYCYEALVNEGVPVVTVDGGSHSIALQSSDLVAAHVRDFADSVAAELGNAT